MKISDDQNVVEIGKAKGEFVEKNGARCHLCIFWGLCHLTEPSIPCIEWDRLDGKNGYFKKMED